MDLLVEVTQAIADAAGIPVEELSADTPLESLGITSIQVMTAYVCLEGVLGVSFTGDDIAYEPAATIREVTAAVARIHAVR